MENLLILDTYRSLSEVTLFWCMWYCDKMGILVLWWA